jgi:FkbM family methyltransferase
VGDSRLYRLYNRKFGTLARHSISFFINEYSRTRKSIYFLQVGANDGVTWDPCYFFVRRDRWTGTVIEPQKEVFDQQLKLTYGNMPGVRLMNVAVDTTDGFRQLYRYSFSNSRWATGLASFDKQRLIDNFGTDYIQNNLKQEHLTIRNDPNEYLVADMVQCMSFDSILGTLKRDAIDFLITDVEGEDVRILNTFPFDRIRPANVVFELPIRRDAMFGALLEKLAEYEYDVFISRSDAIALRRTPT